MNELEGTPQSAPTPFLEHYPESCDPPQRIPLEPLPFRIGRGGESHFIIYSRQVSKTHTEIYRADDRVCIRDLESTNGTFVNGKKVETAVLNDGDIVHIAHKEFRFGSDATVRSRPEITLVKTDPARSDLPASLIRGSKLIQEMIAQNAIRILFQPVVELHGARVIGYEALGRGNYEHLATEPVALLKLAEQCHLAPELSQLFRTVAIEEACALPEGAHVFLNLHPSEMENEHYIEVLREMSVLQSYPQRFFIEVHEGGLTDPERLAQHRNQLAELGIGLAFDDFGAGQARLQELIQVPPDYLKLSMGLIRGIDRDETRQDLVGAIAKLADKRSIRVVAEGIETTEEAATCLRLGCQYAQGFHFGRPEPLPENTVSRRQLAAWAVYDAQLSRARA